MSKENLNKFMKAVAENKEIFDKLKNFNNDIDALVAYGRELGFDFGRQDVEEYHNKVIDIFRRNVKKKIEAVPSAASSPGVKNIKSLIKMGETDEKVGRRLIELSSAEPQEFISYGKELGFVFGEDDVREFAKELMEQSDELSDEELEVAAGGLVTLGVMAAGGVTAVPLVAAAFLAAAAAVGVGAAAGGAGLALGVLFTSMAVKK